MPEAIVTKACSATPTSINLSGNFSAKYEAFVDSFRSAERTTIRGSFSPASRSPKPNPSLISFTSISFLNILSDKNNLEFSICNLELI